MNEKNIERVLAKGFEQSDGMFKERLLDRCLAVLGNDDETRELSDVDLDLLSAAGSYTDSMLPPHDNR